MPVYTAIKYDAAPRLQCVPIQLRKMVADFQARSVCVSSQGWSDDQCGCDGLDALCFYRATLCFVLVGQAILGYLEALYLGM
jgi:hypothetical protein